MYNVKTLNSISPKGLELLPNDLFKISNAEDNAPADGIMLRSADMHEMELPSSLLAVARAGAGVNNVPVEKCSEQGIVVFNTPGANANAVKELVIGALIMISRNTMAASQWVQTLKGEGANVSKLVEKGKSKFVGPEISGKRLGVIGLGAIGVKVANTALHLGMEVYGYDPFLSIDAAWNLSRMVKHCHNISEIMQNCDYITLHIPCTADTKGIIGKQTLAEMKDGARILNFARGELVDTKALLDAIDSGHIAGYITDFPADEMLAHDGVISLPHLGASTPESEDNCAAMAAAQIKEYLLFGNIKNSVNFPDVSLPASSGHKICVAHKNEPGLLSSITAVTTKAKLNIENMLNKSKKDCAYTVLETQDKIPSTLIDEIAQIAGIIKVRII